MVLKISASSSEGAGGMYGGGRSLSGNVNENKNSMFKIHLNNELANVVYHYDLICFVQDQYGKQD
jgi:hypothetical protein